MVPKEFRTFKVLPQAKPKVMTRNLEEESLLKKICIIQPDVGVDFTDKVGKCKIVNETEADLVVFVFQPNPTSTTRNPPTVPKRAIDCSRTKKGYLRF